MLQKMAYEAVTNMDNKMCIIEGWLLEMFRQNCSFFVLNMLSLIIYMSDPNGMVYNDDLAKLTLALV